LYVGSSFKIDFSICAKEDSEKAPRYLEGSVMFEDMWVSKAFGSGL
jgi:hypothetical protein